MTIACSSSEKLAVFGGTPVFNSFPQRIWPPTDEETAQALVELYYSRNWSWNGNWERKSSAKLAELHGANHCLFMANGTVTLEAALHVLGIGPGDEVIVPALTWLATAMAAIYLGARPVFVDVEPDTLCLDPLLLEEAITPRTKAIIPVHLYGSMADMDRILEIARKHDLKVIEDCAHAQGGQWNGSGLGSLGDIGSISFQQSKSLSAGEGGAVLTNDAMLARKLHRFKHIGYTENGMQGRAVDSPEAGLICHNYRMTEFQALVLYKQIETLAERTEARNRKADFLRSGLEQIPGLRVQAKGRRSTPGRQSYYNFMTVFDPVHWGNATKQQILAALTKEGVFCGGTYGSVYRHLLWNASPDSYRIHGEYRDVWGRSCRVSEEIGTACAIGFIHYLLDLPESELGKLIEAFAKVQKNAGQLTDLKL